jgi:hypothetical protein
VTRGALVPGEHADLEDQLGLAMDRRLPAGHGPPGIPR